MKMLTLFLLILCFPFIVFTQTSKKTNAAKKVLPKLPIKGCRRIISFGVLPQDLLIEIPKPEYPKTAQALGIKDEVSVQVKVSTKGKVIEAKVLKGHILLQKVSLESAWKAKFKVYRLDPTPICYFAPLHFKFSE